MDNSIDWTDHDTARVFGDDRALINRVHKLKEKHPDLVVIEFEPENNFGAIVAKVPRSWVRITPPRAISEEERALSAARLAEYRKNTP